MSARIKKSSINLLLEHVSDRKFSEQLLAWTITYGRYIIIITQITVLTVFFARFKLDRDYADLKESVGQKQVLFESISEVETEIRRIQAKLAHVGKLLDNQTYPLDTIRFLQKNSPQDAQFSSLSIEDDILRFTATTESFTTFNVLISQLQEAKSFSGITVEDINRRKDGRIEFRVNATITNKSLIPT